MTAPNNVVNLPNWPAPSEPMKVARRVIDELFRISDRKLTLAFWRGEWWRWKTTHWEPWGKNGGQDQVENSVWLLLEDATYLSHTAKGDRITQWSPTDPKVKNVVRAMKVVCSIDDAIEAPAYISKPIKPAGRVVVFENGTLDIDSGTFTEGHDPTLFNVWSLPYKFDDQAKCPEWEKFVNGIFEHDKKAKLLLQQWFGYLISGRTDLQVMLVIIGPKRGGKGTISRTAKALMGANNVTSPTLATIAGEFGLESLIGKPLAIFEDARDAGRRMGTATERILNITGEDHLSINRKGIAFWDGKLTTRLMLISNEVPKFPDNSGAIATRSLAVRLEKSFSGKEDRGLGARLSNEMPGIFQWALAGYASLVENGDFVRADSADDVDQLLKDLAQPIMCFFDDTDCYEITGNQNDHSLVKDVHSRYRQWCENQGEYPKKQADFQQACDAIDGIRYKNTAVGNEKKARRLFGVKELKPPRHF